MEWRRRRGGAVCVVLLVAYNFFVCFIPNYIKKETRKLELEKAYPWEGLPLITVCSHVAVTQSQTPCVHSMHRHTRHTNRVHARVQPLQLHQTTTIEPCVAALGVFFSCVRVAVPSLCGMPMQKSSNGSVGCRLETSLNFLFIWLFGSVRTHVGILQCSNCHVFTATWANHLFSCKLSRHQSISSEAAKASKMQN